MNAPSLSSETVHASAVAIGGRAVLIGGRSGHGKSDLAMRLIDRGAVLISDDYTFLRRVEGKVIAGAPATIVGKVEMRGVGLIEEMDNVQEVPVALYVDLDRTPERLPEPGGAMMLAGISIPTVAMNGLEASAPLKVETALRLFGLSV
ncbi:MAG TPA: aldolase [Allosphingosinicella sp.]|nr:aldolase [Allosphingosinicella sp.]